MKDRYHVVIVGGGTAGLTVAAQLRNLTDPPDVAIIEPSSKHYYQPIWTLVGAGVVQMEESERDEADFIPPGADWVQDAVETFDPENNVVSTRDGKTIGYDYLVVCPGIKLDWGALPGLAETIGKNGVCSNYDRRYAPYTWECLQRYNGGNAIFTSPNTPIKCGGAPQKIMYLAAHYFQQRGLLEPDAVKFFTPGTVIFGVPEFARTLRKVVDRYGISVNLYSELIEVRGDKKEVVVRNVGEEANGQEQTLPFEMLHVTPPQSAPDFIKSSVLANADGWIDVDQSTLQHVRYPNIFGLGDATSTPNAKTGAAVRKQAPVVVHNMLQHMQHAALPDPKTYNGYSSCPLVTGFGKLVLAEFDYENRPDPSFTFDTTQERYSMYALKLYGLPRLYWHGMLKGRA